MKLTIELVPKTCWYTNVRSNVTSDEWDIIRKKCYKEAGNKCEICEETGKEQGYKHNVECHEIWEYDDRNHIQKLIRLIALCPNCHKTKHVGFAQINGDEEIVINQLMFVNKISEEHARNYIKTCFNKWAERSQHEWELDITYLDTYMMDDNDKFLSMFKG
jgi:hypothetical protein